MNSHQLTSFKAVPLGSAKNAWGQVISALQDTIAVHIQVHDEKGRLEVEEWLGKGSFIRDAGYKDGQLAHISLRGIKTVDYDVKNNLTREYSTSQTAPTRDLISNLRAAFNDMKDSADLTMVERRAGNYSQVEISGSVQIHSLNILGTEYSPGEQILLRLLIEPGSGRLHSLEQHRLDATGLEQESSFASFQWELEAPPELRKISYPPGTRVERSQ